MAKTDQAVGKNINSYGHTEWISQNKKNTTFHAMEDDAIIAFKNFQSQNSRYDNPNAWINGNGSDNVTFNYTGSIHGISLRFDPNGHTRDGRDYYWRASGGYDKGGDGPKSLDVWMRDVAVLDATESADTIDMRDLDDASLNFAMVKADAGNDTIYGSDFADVIFAEKGNDTVYAGDGDDYVSMGSLNAGDQDQVWLGAGNDILSLAALGSSVDADNFNTGQSFLTNLSEEGLNAAVDMGMFALTSSPLGMGAKLGVVAALNIAKSGSGLFADWLGHNMENAGDGSYDNDESSFVKLMDGNLAEDVIILPLLDFDTIETGESIGNYTKSLSLDAENGGKFLQFTFDSSILTDAEAAFGVSDTAAGDFYDSLWEHYTHSIVTFAKDDAGNVTIHTGTAIDGNENTASADEYGDGFDDLISDISGQLQKGTQLSIMGNAFGINADMTNSSRFAVGTNVSDTFEMGERADLNGEFMAMGLGGNDIFIIDQANAFYLIDGGSGIDTINFSNMQEGGSGTLSEGVNIRLYYETLDTGHTGNYSNQIINVENVYGTDFGDLIDGSRGDNTLNGAGGNDDLDGGRGDDTLYGGTGNDTVDGGRHDDRIYGGDGNDRLIGGSGGDIFFFKADESGDDTITDFDRDEGDIIDLDGSMLDDFNFSFAQNGSDVLITYDALGGGTNKITVENSSLSDVQAATVDTVICTHMHKHGYISDEVFQWDSYYGANVLGETVIRGYHAWAIPFVKNVLEQSDLATRLVAPLAQGWALEMAHRCDPAAHPKGSVVGKTILTLGVPLCRALGKVLDKTSGAQAAV